jgi:hypothetical protein
MSLTGTSTMRKHEDRRRVALGGICDRAQVVE